MYTRHTSMAVYGMRMGGLWQENSLLVEVFVVYIEIRMLQTALIFN